MKKLRDVWEGRGMSPTQVAGQARISTTTLYKLARGEQVSPRTKQAVCDVLRITIEQLEALELEREERK